VIIDVHCHYTFTRRTLNDAERFRFEPLEEHGRRAVDSFISPRIIRTLTWRLMRRVMGFDARLEPGEAFDRVLDAFYEKHLCAESPIDRHVLLAFDSYHDREGRRPPAPERRRDRGSDIYSSNTLVRAACRARPDRFLFGASVHPYRENALECVEQVFAAGACLLKWLPLHQNIAANDPRTIAVLRRCAELGLPVLAHYGEEFTLTTQHREYVSVLRLLDTLRALRADDAMPITIIAHVATPCTPMGSSASYRALCEALLGEFADEPLYADISALTAWGKVKWLRRIAKRQELHGKLLFGTDFPVPLGLRRLRGSLRNAYADIASQPTWPGQALAACQAIGVNEIVFHRAATLLPNVDAFTPVATT